MRNTLEEIGRGVILSAALGISRYRAPANGVTYLRDCFLGQAGRQTNQALDEGIEHARRLTIGQMQARTARLRSPVVIRGVLQYLNGSRHPLNLIF